MAAPIYFDHAATTPLTDAAAAAWSRHARTVGNPSSAHGAGRAARRALEEAREQVAALLGAEPLEVVFTSGGTEADNLAIRGIAQAQRAADPARRRVLVSAVEHPAALRAAQRLAHEGFAVDWLPVHPDGRVDAERAEAVIAADPAAVA
ncbi:MAG: aminotransferase class V-fold PLP-dependent enzyme, partial [Propionibacteriaceae bacterium]|nr:aminotransferase class V-fold PLP-dependent enzyme [Propionibacteriaceae bacterium]